MRPNVPGSPWALLHCHHTTFKPVIIFILKQVTSLHVDWLRSARGLSDCWWSWTSLLLTLTFFSHKHTACFCLNPSLLCDAFIHRRIARGVDLYGHLRLKALYFSQPHATAKEAVQTFCWSWFSCQRTPQFRHRILQYPIGYSLLSAMCLIFLLLFESLDHF